MKFHRIQILWDEIRGRLPRHVTEEKFYAVAMAGGDRTGNGLVSAAGNHNVHGGLHCESSRPAACAWLAVLTLGMIAVSAPRNPRSQGRLALMPDRTATDLATGLPGVSTTIPPARLRPSTRRCRGRLRCDSVTADRQVAQRRVARQLANAPVRSQERRVPG